MGQLERRRPAVVGGGRRAVERVESRVLLAAHVVGSAVVYPTIQAAVNAAPAGGTVTVDAGTYAEQVTVSKSLTVSGARAGIDARGGGRPAASAATESVVTGGSTTNGRSSAFHVLANDVTVDGFTVTGETDQDDQLGAGIVIGPGRSGTHLLNDVVRNNVSGLFLANASPSDAAVIRHCYFGSNNNAGENGGRGIYTDGTVSGGGLTNVTIDANTFANNRGSKGTTGYEAALAFEAGRPGGQSAIRITNNAFSGNGKAVLFFNATNVLVQGNAVTTCQDRWSGSLRFEGHNDNVSILYNDVYDNTGPGVAVDSKGTPGDNFKFVVNGNNFYGNNGGYSVPISVAANFDTYDGSFDARYNYWGSSSGPSGYGPGSGDAVGGGFFQTGTGSGWKLTTGGDVLFAPWSTVAVSPPGSAPAAPGGLTATGTSPTQVNLSWTDNAAGNETGFVVQRSADGTTFTQIGTTGSGVTTYADAAGLAAGKAYRYRVLAVNATGTSGASNVATGTTLPSTATTALSDLAWTSATTGYGTIHKDASVDGNPLSLRGTPYAKGIGTHSVSTITYALNGGYGAFAVDVGVDDEVGGSGSVDFRVLGDGKTLFDSGVLTGTSAVAHVNVSVAGVQALTLMATNGVAGTIDYDHADWADPQLTAAAPASSPPTPIARTGTVIGTAGSYHNAGNTIANAVDGNLGTYVDAAAASGNWVGLDLGTAKSVRRISFAPRAGWAARMVGGTFQASTSAAFTTGVTTLYTVTTAPAVGSLTTVALASPVTARYFRYLSPAGSYGNVAEIQFAG